MVMCDYCLSEETKFIFCDLCNSNQDKMMSAVVVCLNHKEVGQAKLDKEKKKHGKRSQAV